MIANWFAWAMHVAVTIAAGILASQCFQWKRPQSRMRFYQLLLLTGIVLPLVEPRRALTAPAVISHELVLPMQSAPVSQMAAATDWDSILMIVFLGGVLARLGLLAVGLLRLAALRRRGISIQVEGVCGVDIRVVEGLRGPAAFGWRDPVILLPAGLPDALQDIAIRHELQHVLRRDWLENMLERVAASILWFHPMAWWLLERIHLAREQAVDLEVAGLGAERDEYLQSLLASAGLANSLSMPAASFVRRPRHLVERVAFLTKETTMSIRTAVASAAITIATTGAALTLAGIYLPFQLTAQQAAISPTAPTHMTFQVKSPGVKVEGVVQLDATFNSEGEVIEARVLSGPDELRNAALKEVLSKRLMPDQVRTRIVPVSVEFRQGAGIPPVPSPPQPPPVDEAEFEGIDYQGLSPELQQRAAGVLGGLQSGQHLTSVQIDEFRSQLARIDPALKLGVNMRKAMSKVDVNMHKTAAGPILLRLGVHTQAPSLSELRVQPDAMQMNLIHKVEPEYPPLARQARIQGTVRMDIAVGKEGSVEKIHVVAGHPMLIPAAEEAVKQYKYRPTNLNGQPTAVQTTIDVNFTL